jgi:hypothetical protein
MGRILIDQNVRREIANQGFAWIPRASWSIDPSLELHWDRFRDDWDRLELDRYLEHRARFRLRRYGRFFWSPDTDELTELPHSRYFQPAEENSYAGGIERSFAPLLPHTSQNPFLQALVRSTFASLPVAAERQRQTWEVRVHQIRIVATPAEPGFPAPEGIHQDGTDFLTLHLVRRVNIAGGESTIYDLDRNPIQRMTLRETLDSLILEDPRIMHGVTPVQSADGINTGTRDLLGIDFILSPYMARHDNLPMDMKPA